MNPVILILLMFPSLLQSCAAKKNRSVGFTKISSAAVVTRIKTVNHFNLVAMNGAENNFCYVENSKLTYFINAQKYDKPLTFFEKSLAHYQNLSEGDLIKMMTHRYLREIYCGKIYRNPKSKKTRFYFSLENEENVNLQMISEIYKSLRSRISIQGSKIFFFYQNDALYKENHRAIKSKGLPVTTVQNLKFIKNNSEQNAVDSQSRNIELFSPETTLTAIETTTGTTTLKTSLYGHRASLDYYSDEKRMFVPFALNEYFMNSQLDVATCDEAKTKCSASRGNSCQLPHGICLNTCMKIRRTKTSDVIKSLMDDEKKLEPTAKNSEYFQSKITFISALFESQKIDQRIFKEIESKIQKEFKGSRYFNLYPSLNIAGLDQDQHDFLKPVPVCINTLGFSCLQSYDKNFPALAEGIIDIFKNIYSKELVNVLNSSKFAISDVRAAFEINRSIPNSQMVGYAYIHPDGQSRSFALKLINLSTKNMPTDPQKPIYLNISTENKINQKMEKPKTKRNDASISKALMEKVVLSVKNQYLSEIRENKSSDRRLYTFKYEIDENGLPVLSSSP